MITTLPPWLIAVAIAGVALVLVKLLQWLFTSGEKPPLEKRLSDDSGILDEENREVADALALTPRGQSAFQRFDTAFDRMILRTGLEVTSTQAIAFMLLIGVVIGGVLHLWRDEPWLTLLGVVVGMGVPLILFWLFQSRYQSRLQNQLPDCLFLLARSLRAGMNLEQSMELLAERGVKPLANEFNRCNAQVRLGLMLPAALQLMARRVQLLDFNAFVSTVSYYQKTGGNLPLMLDRLAAGTRDRNQFRGQFFALTAQARVTAISLGLAPFILLGIYALWQPEHVHGFFRSSTGWMMIGGALVVQLIGAVWLYRLLRIDY